MCRVQRDTVSYSSATCHLYLGHFSSLCQYSVPWLLSLPRPSQYQRRGAVHLGTGPAAGPVALWGYPGTPAVSQRWGDRGCVPVPGPWLSCLPHPFLSAITAVSFLHARPQLQPRGSAGGGASSTSWRPRFCLLLLIRSQATDTHTPAVNYDIKISMGLIIGFVCFLQTDAPLFVEPVL